MADFADWTLQDARQALPALDSGSTSNELFYTGDHWQSGDGWIGPRPAAGEVGGATVLIEIERALVSKNAVREVLTRHGGAVLGHEPTWSLTPARALADGEDPTPDEQALIDEAETALTAWWDVRGAHACLRMAAIRMLYAGRGCVRMYVPSGLLDDAGRVPPGDLTESFSRLYLDDPKPDQADVITDSATQREAGIYCYQDGGGDYAEMVFVDPESGYTTLRIMSGAADKTQRAPLDLGGRLTIYALRREPLITPQVRQQQRLLNLAKTMLGRNVVLGGFLERIILNAQLPGTITTNAAGVKTFTPDPLKLGAGTTNVFAGLPITDEGGRVTGYATPSVIYRDPVPVTTFEETARSAYLGILEETQQLYAAIAGDATASGESRTQARADFTLSLGDTIAQVEQAGRWLIETALAMAAAFSGQPGRYEALRATFTCRVDTGPITADEQDQTRQNVAANLLSEETGMERIGVADVDAEKTKIAAQRENAQQARQTNATAILGRAGLLAQQVQQGNGGGNGAA